MMFKIGRNISFILIIFVAVFTIGSVCATWIYSSASPTPIEKEINISLNDFTYGTFYITTVSVTDGNFENAAAQKVSDVNTSHSITLSKDANSFVTFAVTFYNNTDVNYYYNETQTVSTDNNGITYSVSGIEQKEAVAPRSQKTLYVTFNYNDANTSLSSILTELHFSFVVDKDSIGDIVALTAVDRFRDILNDKIYAGSYQSLENGMNNRSGLNKASAVTYIGNVYGSNNSDSNLIKALFGDEFLSMDLDGDGKPERITMMIKREDIDNNQNTGDAYTYTNWGRETTVNGADMTLYITAADLSSVSSGQSVDVWAAAFTKYPGHSEWTDLIKLTKGTASANNYSGYGSANSFNTDTWKSTDGKTIEQLVPTN